MMVRRWKKLQARARGPFLPSSSGRALVVKEKGTDNLADIGTKFLDGPMFDFCRSAVGVRVLSAAAITQLSGCTWTSGSGHHHSQSLEFAVVFFAGILLGIFLSSARGRSTVQVEEEPEPDEQGPVVELAVTTAAAVVPVEDGVAVPADAEVLAAPDPSPNGVWVSVAGERWHRDRGCRGLRGARGAHRVTPCRYCARLG